METYHGHVRTPADAIVLFEACRIGLLPRVQRRLSEKERQTIQSGSIFVWDEREAGMRRWTDGKSWSASRVSGSFLTYREMEGKRGGNGITGPAYPNNGRAGRSDDGNDDGPDGYRYKADGLMKQSFSITTSSGQHLHLISYYSRSTSAFHSLTQPSQDPQLRHIRPEKGMYPESTVHDHNSIPAVTRTPMAGTNFTPPAQGPPPMHAQPYGRPPAPSYHNYAASGWAPPSPLHTPPPYYQQHSYDPHGFHRSPHQQAQYPPYHHAPPAPAPNPFDRVPAAVPRGGIPPARYPHLPPAGVHIPPLAAAPAKIEQSPQPQQPTPGSSIASEGGNRQDSVQPRPGDNAAGRTTTTPPSATIPATSGTVIPSISTLISGAQAASEEHARRAASSSPGNTNATKIPPVRPLQDIPLHKLAFAPASDARALRDLDKATFRV